jgi:hypothetical protein
MDDTVLALTAHKFGKPDFRMHPFRFLKYQKTEGLGLRVSIHRETKIAVKTALEPIVRRSGDPSLPVMDAAGNRTLYSVLHEPSSN